MPSDEAIHTSERVTQDSSTSQMTTTRQCKVTRGNQGTKIIFQIYQQVKIIQVQVYTQNLSFLDKK